MNSQHLILDGIVDEFENVWRLGQRPDLVLFLSRVEADDRTRLARLLIPIDMEFRQKAGDTVTPDDYRSSGDRFENIALEALLPSATGFGAETPTSRIALNRGNMIGPFQLLKPIGKGGMGEVWLAEQTKPIVRQVALKVIRHDFGSREFLARFEAERRSLALMNHPYIARILDAGTTGDGQPWFAMELVTGKPLTTWCDENRLGVDERLRLFMDVCSAVQHAHQKGIIHRDLTPRNILVGTIDGRPVPKVIDFGLAKIMDDAIGPMNESMVTGIGQILGTWKYMSPEQAGLDQLDIDTRTDIYALGVILYELLTGSTPLDDSSLDGMERLKILQLIREREAVKPSSRLSKCTAEQISTITDQRKTDTNRLGQALTGDLDWIVMKALEKDRTRRYESASGFAADIGRYLANEPIEARPPSLKYRVQKFARKNRALVVSAGVTFVVLVVGLIATATALNWALLERNEARTARTELANQNAELTRQKEDLQKVIDFQVVRILPVNPTELGGRIRTLIMEQRRGLLTRQAKPADAVAAELAEFERELAPVNFADVGMATLSENLLGRLSVAVEGAFSDRPDIRLQLLESLAASALDLGALDTALSLQTAVVALRGIVSSPLHEKSLAAESARGLILHMLGQYENADQLLKKTHETCGEELGTAHEVTVNTAIRYAQNLKRMSRFDEAESVARQAALWADSFSPDEFQLRIHANHLLGQTLSELMKYEEAQQLLKNNLDQARGTLPPGDADLISAIGEYGLLLQRMRKWQDAEPLLRECYTKCEEHRGRYHPQTLEAINNLGSFLTSWKSQSEALPLLEESLVRHREVFGEFHLQTLIAGQSVGVPYFFRREYDKAIAVFENILPGLELSAGPTHEATVLVRANLGINYREVGRMDDAIRLLEQAYTDRHASQDLAFIAKELFETCMRAETLDRAKEIAFAELEIINERSPNPTPERLLALWPVGNWLRRVESWPEAEAALRECLQIREKFEAGDWKLYDNQSVLGEVLMKQGKTNEADELLHQGYDGLASVADTIPKAWRRDHIPNSLRRLIDFHQDANQPEMVSQYEERLKEYEGFLMK